MDSRARSRLGCRRRRCRPLGEDGFTIIESALALSLIFMVCLALLSSLATGVRGVVTGRQRSGATQLANQVIEMARARSYSRVGHTLSDTTLPGDAAITGSNPNFYFDGQPLAIETQLTTPFDLHSATTTIDGVQYTRNVYVTRITPGSGDPYKRVTATVSWTATQYGSAAIPNRVSLTAYVFDSAAPPDPLLKGVVDTDSGHFTVTGSLAGINLSDLQAWFPYSHGEINSSFIKQAKGFAWTGRTQLNLQDLLLGPPTGCNLSGVTAGCAGTKAETVADNDGGTAPPENDSQGPVTDPGGAINGGLALPLQATIGTGSASAQSTARSCFSCFGPDIGDDDLFPYHASSSTGPGSGGVTFGAGPVSGSLLAGNGAGCSISCAVTTVDVDKPGGSPRITSTATTSAPALDLLTLTGAAFGYNGMVRIPANTVTATAAAGPGAPAPTFTGAAFNLQMYQTGGVPGYVSVPITPGVAHSQSTSASFNVGLAAVQLDATVIARAGTTASTLSGTDRVHAEASLTNWLTISVRLRITLLGSPLADLTSEFDYGLVSASADYAPAP